MKNYSQEQSTDSLEEELVLSILSVATNADRWFDDAKDVI